MSKFLEKTPSKKMNRLFLIIGVIIFIPVYYLNYLTSTKIFEPDVLSKLLTSFDTDYFKEVFFSVSQRGQLNDLFTVYLLNIVSVIGFALIFFALTIIIARSITKDSKLYKISFIFPVIVMIIALLEYCHQLPF